MTVDHAKRGYNLASLQIRLKTQLNKLIIEHNSICEMLTRILTEHMDISEHMLQIFNGNNDTEDFAQKNPLEID